METNQSQNEFTCAECGEEYLGNPYLGDNGATCSECMEGHQFTIGEVAQYLAGWSVGEFDEVGKIAKATLHNALVQLRDPHDGIQACRLRGVLRPNAREQAAP